MKKKGETGEKKGTIKTTGQVSFTLIGVVQTLNCLPWKKKKKKNNRKSRDAGG